VYYKDGKFVAILGPGQYAYWLKMGKVKFFPIDMRETVLDIGGQEIMTSDKVTLRLNAILTYRVSDARKAVETVSDVGQALYRETQPALRAVVGTRELDAWLALSLVTGKAFCIENIRARRQKPGLLRQHLTAVKAATEIGQAHVEGDSIGSTRLAFVPAAVRPDSYHWAIGTAGSTTLVLQTVLPCLLTADRDTEIILEGGTHNQFAPPFEFLAQAFLPIVNRMVPDFIRLAAASSESRSIRRGSFPESISWKEVPSFAGMRQELLPRFRAGSPRPKLKFLRQNFPGSRNVSESKNERIPAGRVIFCSARLKAKTSPKSLPVLARWGFRRSGSHPGSSMPCGSMWRPRRRSGATWRIN
jgi:hypothetical protein